MISALGATQNQSDSDVECSKKKILTFFIFITALDDIEQDSSATRRLYVWGVSKRSGPVYEWPYSINEFTSNPQKILGKYDICSYEVLVSKNKVV